MGKSWKPQVRSFFANRIPFWTFITIIVIFLICFIYQHSTLIVTLSAVIIYFAILLGEYLHLKQWKVEGFEEISIYKRKKLIVFDKKIKIPFKDIKSINYVIENNPNLPLLLRTDLFFDNGRIDLIRINAKLYIYTYSFGLIEFSIQNKFFANQILKYLKKCDFNVITEDNRTFNFRFALRVLILIIAIIGLIVIKIKQTYLLM